MIKRVLLVVTLGVMLSGCFMAPLALIGPATSGFSTASIMQAGMSTGANYMVKKSTGKTIGEHALEAINKDVLQQTYMPEREKRKASGIIPFTETFR
tara:strand:- start:418 stop:708 length:291 start_codon:yes stop_codon:yes gene_type:complete